MCIKKVNSRGRYPKSEDLLLGVSKPQLMMKKRASASMRVREVKAFNAGKLENVLIPVLITAGIIRKNAANCSKEKIIGKLDGIPIVIKDDRGPVKQEQEAASCSLSKAESGFIQTLVHALNCKSCELSGCKKMRLVIGHFLSCKKMSLSLSCTVCNQMLKVINKHAENCSFKANTDSCPVPLCDSIRAENHKINNIINNFTSTTTNIVHPMRG